MQVLTQKSTKLLSIFVFAFCFQSCLITDLLSIQPLGGIPVETVVRQAAGSTAEGWFLGCGAALATQNDKFTAAGSTDCGGVHSGAEFFALYGTAARNAANEMIPLARANRHFYYKSSSLEDCKSAALLQSYLMTKLYLESTIKAGSDALGADDFAASTVIGVTGAGAACFQALEGTGRVISVGELAL